MWPGGVPDTRAPARFTPVLVGRADLVALAERRLAAARSGSGHLLLFAGEAGIGKTRLLAEVAARAADQGVPVVRAATYPRDVEVAGGVLVDLAAELSHAREPGIAAAGRRMAERLRRPQRAESQRPESQRAESQRAGHEPAEPQRAGGDAHRGRRILLADLTACVESACPEPAGADADPGTGLLLALEDLHWADELTLAVLDRLAERLPRLPMLVIGTYRSDELYPRVPVRQWRTRLLTQRLAEEARLPRLDALHTTAMVAAITGGTPPATLTAALYQRSDGIPLHIEELLAGTTPGGATPDGADPDGSGPGGTGAGVPDSLADAVLGRAQALSPAARDLAGAASAIGRSFDVDLLTAVSGEAPAAVDAGLRELADRYFVLPRTGTATYDFRHALIREALYADLAPHRRRELHGRVADAAVVAGFGDAFVSGQYERAGRPAPAYHHALVAAAEAGTVSAHREAVVLYRRAQRTQPTGVPPSGRADLLAALAAELAASDDNTAAADAYAQAHRLRLEIGDVEGAAALVPSLVAARHLLGADLTERSRLLTDALALLDRADDTHSVGAQRIRVRILAALAAAYMLDRRLDEAAGYGGRARELAGDLAGAGMDEATLLDVDATVGAVSVFAGRMDEGWRLMEAAVARGRDGRLEGEAARAYRMLGSCASVLVEYDSGERWLADGIAYTDRVERWNDRHYLAAHHAHVRWAVGDWAGARQEAERALVDGGGVTTRITALHVLGYLALGRAEWDAAADHLDRARDLGEAMGELQRLSPALWGLAETAQRRGQPVEAVRWCERGYAASAAVDDAAYLFPFVVTGVRAYLDLDQPGAARDFLSRVAGPLLLRRIPGTLPALRHAEGLLELAEGHTAKAREALAEAGTAWDARRRFWEGTQALVDQARCAARSRRHAQAASLAAQARERALGAGATTLLAAADAIPVRPAGGSGTGGSPLSARELEVARLIATGATNPQIAQALHIAPKTVAAHVEHILTKLGAVRRTEVAAWFATRDATTRDATGRDATTRDAITRG